MENTPLPFDNQNAVFHSAQIANEFLLNATAIASASKIDDNQIISALIIAMSNNHATIMDHYLETQEQLQAVIQTSEDTSKEDTSK